jgi:LacI family transcriptional regulator
MKKRKSTLKDVARIAGVSPASVSHVINKTKKLSAKTESEVLKAVEQLKYQPNNVAKSLRVQKTNLIAVMISDITNPFFANIVRAIEQELAKFDYNMLLCNTDQDTEKEKLYLDIMLSKRVDGIIVSSAQGYGDHFKNFDDFGIPLVFLNRYPEHVYANTVVTDNYTGAYMATNHLIQHGYQSIAIISGPDNIMTGLDRLKGYRKCLTEQGLDFNASLVYNGDFRVESGYENMKKIMQATKHRPEAVFISNNQMTLGAYKYIKENGFSIPSDISIVGYDDSNWGTVVDPPLSTVRQPSEELGRRAANLIMECILANKVLEKKSILLQPELIVRKSCGC